MTKVQIAMRDTKYLGTCWERFQKTDGSIELTKLHLCWLRGRRSFALTEAEARRWVDETLAEVLGSEKESDERR